MKRTLTIAICGALGLAANSAEAVMLNPRGTGQVLIYPYYTVNHQQTLLSVINSHDEGKALKVRLREAYDGREVVSFDLYLGPFDTWVGAIYDASSDGSGGAAIGTNDNSCTVPAFGTAPFAGGPPSLVFSNANYTQGDYGAPTGTDSGPTGLNRTREGFLEIIEMGVVANTTTHNSLKAITAVNGKPPGCTQVRSAWASGGYWATNAQTDVTTPTGGLFGAASIVDVAQGTLYAYDATAIEGFSDVAQHTGPADTKPNLSTAVTDSAHQIASAYVPTGNAVVQADYPAGTRGIDAVSAVLMADALYNEFEVEGSLGAATDWLVSFPTKQFYVDPGIVGTQLANYLPPFGEVFGGGLQNGTLTDPGESCGAQIGLRFFDREGTPPSPGINFCPPPPVGGQYLCYESEVISFSTLDAAPSLALGSRIGVNTGAAGLQFATGQVQFSFVESYSDLCGENSVTPIPSQVLRPANNGDVFRGIPAVGFAAINYINANVTPGVLSNYSGAYPHRATASCMNSTNPQNTCP